MQHNSNLGSNFNSAKDFLEVHQAIADDMKVGGERGLKGGGEKLTGERLRGGRLKRGEEDREGGGIERRGEDEFVDGSEFEVGRSLMGKERWIGEGVKGWVGKKKVEKGESSMG